MEISNFQVNVNVPTSQVENIGISNLQILLCKNCVKQTATNLLVASALVGGTGRCFTRWRVRVTRWGSGRRDRFMIRHIATTIPRRSIMQHMGWKRRRLGWEKWMRSPPCYWCHHK
jgi:hypothetical protein